MALNQNDRILDHLEAGHTITQLEAMTIFHIQSLTKRIAELRSYGYVITREQKTDPNGQTYAVYYMPAYRQGRAA